MNPEESIGQIGSPRWDLVKKCFEHTISNNILSKKNIPRFALSDVQLDQCLGNLTLRNNIEYNSRIKVTFSFFLEFPFFYLSLI